MNRRESPAWKIFARDLFLGTGLSDALDTHAIGDWKARHELEQLVSSWSALTAQRRAAVLGYVADQVALSDLDRKREAAGPSRSEDDR